MAGPGSGCAGVPGVPPGSARLTSEGALCTDSCPFPQCRRRAADSCRALLRVGPATPVLLPRWQPQFGQNGEESQSLGNVTEVGPGSPSFAPQLGCQLQDKGPRRQPCCQEDECCPIGAPAEQPVPTAAAGLHRFADCTRESRPGLPCSRAWQFRGVGPL